jgi:tRNA uridine 5-carbamoylmethylation protein Kti12
MKATEYAKIFNEASEKIIRAEPFNQHDIDMAINGLVKLLIHELQETILKRGIDKSHSLAGMESVIQEFCLKWNAITKLNHNYLQKIFPEIFKDHGVLKYGGLRDFINTEILHKGE